MYHVAATSGLVERYVSGNLRDVWFYRADVEAHAEKTYRPGLDGK